MPRDAQQAVYEALLSFRGFFAEEDLYEVRPDPKGKKAPAADDGEEGADESEGREPDAEDQPADHEDERTDALETHVPLSNPPAARTLPPFEGGG